MPPTGSPSAPSVASGRLTRADIAVITIREDEFKAVVDRLPNPKIERGQHRTYVIGTVFSDYGSEYRIAVLRCIEQGPNSGQDAARDMIEDLDPQWLALVGIGGAVPDTEFTLGDVVVATRLHDFTVGAMTDDSKIQFADQGGPMKKEIQDLLAILPALLPELDDWNSSAALGVSRPSISLDAANFYGPAEWRKKTEEALLAAFSPGESRGSPKVVTRPVASSGFLIKDAEIIDQWRQTARDLCAVEMELAGVYSAARRRGKEYPILAIRGISDVVGFKRSHAWTSYACQAAASLFFSLVKNISPSILPPLPRTSEAVHSAPSSAYTTSNDSLGFSIAVSESCKPELPKGFEDRYLRRFRCWSVTPLERNPAELWEAAAAARLSEHNWPWSITYYLQNGQNDFYVKRAPSTDGFSLRYLQTSGYYLYEEIAADGAGSLNLFESQAFQNTDREGFPYDTAIATVADAIRFAVRFFQNLRLGGDNDISIEIEWSGFERRHITAATVPMNPAMYYFKKVASTNQFRSPAVQLKLANVGAELVPAVNRLLGGLFSQFDFFAPEQAVFERIIRGPIQRSGP